MSDPTACLGALSARVKLRGSGGWCDHEAVRQAYRARPQNDVAKRSIGGSDSVLAARKKSVVIAVNLTGSVC